MTGTLTQAQAHALAEELDLGLDGVCLVCLSPDPPGCVIAPPAQIGGSGLSFVSFALERGEPREIASELRRMTPELWADGLAERAVASVGRLVDAGVPEARDAELERRGARGDVARAIVRRLASELSARTRVLREEAAMN